MPEPSAPISSAADAAARSAALLVFRGDLETLVVTGPDRLEWLEAVLTCDVQGLAPGAGRWSLALAKPGKILADLLVLETGTETYLGVPRTARERVHGFLAGFLVMEDADITWTEAFAWATLHGPDAQRVAPALAAAVAGHAAAVELTGLGDAAIVYPVATGDALRSAAYGDGRVTVATDGDWERLRVERRVPTYGKDVFDTTSPHEASLERRCISWEKGCYLGQEAVCMQEMRGKVKRRTALVRLEAPDGAVPPDPGTPVKDAAGTLLGETRSAVSSAVHAGAVALAVIAASSAEPGTAVWVGDRAGTVVAPDR